MVRGKGLEQIEGTGVFEDLRVELDRGVGREDSRAPVGALLGVSADEARCRYRERNAGCRW